MRITLGRSSSERKRPRAQLLTPAQRAAEDAKRKAEEARNARNLEVATLVFLALIVVIGMVIVLTPHNTPSPTPAVQVVVEPQPTPTPIPATIWTDEDWRRFNDPTLNAPPTHSAPRAERVHHR
jgi:hypothetical protein